MKNPITEKQTYISTKHQKESVEALKQLIGYPSVCTSDGTTNPPFGEGVQACLEGALEIAGNLGMKTFIDPEGFYGYAEYGEGEEMIGVLCHLDVVPGGDLSLWNTDPFEGVVKDGIMYGRGSQDDKGPTIAALYAFKAVVDAGLVFDKRIRFVFGTDEETLWRCMAHYNAKEEAPTRGFVPDSTFPLTYAEKGLLQAKLVGPGSKELALNNGDAPNVVPGTASYEGTDAAQVAENLTQLGVDCTLEGNKVTVNGKAVHASTAGNGINAVNQLAQGLAVNHAHPSVQFLAEKVGSETNGFSIFGEIKDEVTGELTFNVASLNITEESSEILLDLRVPVKYELEDLAATLTKVAGEYGLSYQQVDAVHSLYVSKESEMVQTFTDIYQSKTGDMTEPFAIGGATYARTMDNMVAFGARFPGSPSLAHQANEGLNLEDMYKAMDIYAEAIATLCCKPV